MVKIMCISPLQKLVTVIFLMPWVYHANIFLLFCIIQHSDLFSKNLVKPGWTREYILNNQTFFRNFADPEIARTLPEGESSENIQNSVSVAEKAPKKVLSQQAKYRLVFSKCKLIASLCSEDSGENFDHIINSLNRFIYFWKGMITVFRS